jgi:plastocyanin
MHLIAAALVVAVAATSASAADVSAVWIARAHFVTCYTALSPTGAALRSPPLTTPLRAALCAFAHHQVDGKSDWTSRRFMQWGSPTPSPPAPAPAGTEIAVSNWVVRSYSDLTATVGDTAVFTWSGGHNVYLHPSGDCDQTDATGPTTGSADTSGATFALAEAGTYVFACDVGSHCENGQIVTITVSAAAEPEPCPAGAAGDPGACVDCPTGKFSADAGSAICLACAAGTYADMVGATACTACAAGTYLDVTGGAACNACPADTYTATVGATACTSCPDGTTAAGTGSDDAADCVEAASSSTPAPPPPLVCTDVANADAATLTCTDATDSQVTACLAGFNLCESSGTEACADGTQPDASADACVPNPTCGNVDDDDDGGSEPDDAFACADGYDLQEEPNTITCAAAACTADDCCVLATPTPDPAAPPAPENSVAAQLTLDIEMPAEAELDAFKGSFSTDVAATLTGVSAADVVVTSVAPGSVVVDFYIAPAADGSALVVADAVTTALGKQTALFAPFIYKMHYFTKTGSGRS